MKIHEYQAKDLFRSYNVTVPEGYPAFSVKEALEAYDKLNTETVVVKAQIHAGGRGKGGGVKLAHSRSEVEELARKILGMNLITHQTGSDGKEVQRILIEKGVNILSLSDGFYKNEKVKIPFPPEAENIKKQLKKIGMGKEIDKVILSINRAAEDAIVSAGPIFSIAIKKMTLVDAISIVKGHNTAGTDYLYTHTISALINEFKPIIKSSLQKVNATKYWKSVMKIYNKIPFVKKINPDLELYVTQKTIEGLFSVLAEEEIEIRKNPIKRTTDLLKKVFGS